MASLTTTLNGFGRGLNRQRYADFVGDSESERNHAGVQHLLQLHHQRSGWWSGDFTLSSITNGNARGNNQSVMRRIPAAGSAVDFSHTLFGRPAAGNAGARYVETKMSATGYQAPAAVAL